MRTTHRRRGAPEGEEEEVEEDMGYVNPMAQPPAVGLTLGKGGTLPKFLPYSTANQQGKQPQCGSVFCFFFVCAVDNHI